MLFSAIYLHLLSIEILYNKYKNLYMITSNKINLEMSFVNMQKRISSNIPIYSANLAKMTTYFVSLKIIFFF